MQRPKSFTIIIDTREKTPFRFKNVKTISKSLKTGDYSVLGHESVVAVERKSPTDFYKSVIGDRVRFENEIVRMNEMKHGIVIIERELSKILDGSALFGLKTSPRSSSVFGTILSWQQRYSNVHWLFCSTRSQAEDACFKWLDFFMKNEWARAASETAVV